MVALTRAHPDYAGALYAVLENFRVGEFWHAPEPETPEYAALLETVAERGIPTRTLMAGDTLAFGDASIRVLWPGPDPPSQSPSPVDNSLVIKVSAGSMNFLLPGDAGREVEKEILASQEALESQVLKVAHHGSKAACSRAFLARVAPRLALITCEAGGARADSPNSETLAALAKVGARVFRTDIDGAMTVEAKDGRLVVRTFVGSEPVVIAAGNSRCSTGAKD